MRHREAFDDGALRIALYGDGIHSWGKAGCVDDNTVFVAGLAEDHLTRHVVDDDLTQIISCDTKALVGRVGIHLALFGDFTD